MTSALNKALTSMRKVIFLVLVKTNLIFISHFTEKLWQPILLFNI